MSDIESISLSIPNLSRFLFVSAFVGLEGVTGDGITYGFDRPPSVTDPDDERRRACRKTSLL